MIDVVRIVNHRFKSNTYVIYSTNNDDIWIIDPGEIALVVEWMQLNGKTNITGVLLTHAHFDHIYGINEVFDMFPTTTIYVCNEIGREILYDAKKNGSKFTEQPIVVNSEIFVRIISQKIELWSGCTINTYLTPGHSEDSMCILLDNILFTGDTLIKNTRTVTKLKGGSVDKLKESINWIRSLKGNKIQIYGGHEDPFDLDDYDLSVATKNRLNI